MTIKKNQKTAPKKVAKKSVKKVAPKKVVVEGELPDGFEEFVKAIRERVANGKIAGERNCSNEVAAAKEEQPKGAISNMVSRNHKMVLEVNSLINQIGTKIQSRFHGVKADDEKALGFEQDGIQGTLRTTGENLDCILGTLDSLNKFIEEYL